VALLGLDRLLEAQAHEPDDAREDERCKHVSARGHRAEHGDSDQAPSLRSGDDGKRNPVVRQDRMDHRNGAGSGEEQA
jgi:hypothetical protein